MIRRGMLERAAAPLASFLAAGVALLLLVHWLGAPPPAVPLRLADPANRGAAAQAPPVELEGDFLAFGPLPPPLEDGPSWPRFRGESSDNVSRDATPLAARWPEGGPPELWSLALGEGHGGAAVHGGRVYLLDYLEAEESDAVRCLSLADGRELWRRWYRTGAKRNHGVSRTVPAVSGGFLATIGPRCHVLCLDAATGAFLWGMDLVARYGAKEPLWYSAQCPLIDSGRVILAPGGKALMVAVDAASGKVLWETPNPRGWEMSHASIVPMTLAGRRTFVYPALGGVAGVAADGEDAGALLWETTEWAPGVAAPSPVEMGGDRLLLTAGYGAGGAVLRVVREGERLAARVERRFPPSVLACEQQTPIARDGLLFTVLPPDGEGRHGQFACVDPERGVLWASGRDRRYGLGPFLAVPGGRFLLLSDDGVLTLARGGRDGFSPLASERVLKGRDAWAPMALAGGRLLLRDSKRMACLDLRPGASPGEGR